MSNTKNIKVGDKVRNLSMDGFPWGPELTVLELIDGVDAKGRPLVKVRVQNGTNGRISTEIADHMAVGDEMHKERPMPMSVKRINRVDAELGPLRIKVDRIAEQVAVEMDFDDQVATLTVPFRQFRDFISELADQIPQWE